MTHPVQSPRQFPTLRNLQFSPLKEGEEQYMVLWDPSGLSTEKLIIPLSYFYLLQFFDGTHALDQIASEYLKKFGEFMMPDRLERLVVDLDEKLFLEGDRANSAQAQAIAAYRAAPQRPARYAGKSYEADREKLLDQLQGFFFSKEGPGKHPSEHAGQAVKGLVAPHYEPKDAGPVYAWAYKELKEAPTPDVCVILGTCHAGLENGYAVTDKDFETPLGLIKADQRIIERFKRAGGERFFQEEIAHRHEHSIEFQLPFLQYATGLDKPMTFVPVLCSFPAQALFNPALADLKATIEAFVQAMKTALSDTQGTLCVLASAELAHIGMRYGDASPPTDFSFHRCMQQDMAMLKHVEELNPDAFAQFIAKEADQRRISGFAAIYTLLRLIGAEKGQVLRYDRGMTDQFNSTVTYASMVFH